MMSWRTARSLDTLLAQVNTAGPDRSKASDGTLGDQAHAARESDHNPDSQGVVRARDVTHDPAHGCDVDQVAEELRRSRDPRIRYVIRSRRIFTSYATRVRRAWEWGPYVGSNPHETHMHLSVVGSALADDPAPWAIFTEVNMTEAESLMLADLHRSVVGHIQAGPNARLGDVHDLATPVLTMNATVARIEAALDPVKLAARIAERIDIDADELAAELRLEFGRALVGG